RLAAQVLAHRVLQVGPLPGYVWRSGRALHTRPRDLSRRDARLPRLAQPRSGTREGRVRPAARDAEHLGELVTVEPLPRDEQEDASVARGEPCEHGAHLVVGDREVRRVDVVVRLVPDLLDRDGAPLALV